MENPEGQEAAAEASTTQQADRLIEEVVTTVESREKPAEPDSPPPTDQPPTPKVGEKQWGWYVGLVLAVAGIGIMVWSNRRNK